MKECRRGAKGRIKLFDFAVRKKHRGDTDSRIVRNGWGDTVDMGAAFSGKPPTTDSANVRSTFNVGNIWEWKTVDRGGIEPPTHGFSVRCSTD